jgi:uncharacterized damage-inducible protein DinB
MSLLPDLFRHHRWANLRLIDHLAGMSPEDLARKAPGGFGSIHETLYHLVVNEARFIDGLAERALKFGALPSELPSCQQLRDMAARQAEELLAYSRELTNESRLKGTFNGQPFDMPAYLPLFQAYSHAVEHRTNITSILATYDLPSPALDLWAFQAAGEAP